MPALWDLRPGVAQRATQAPAARYQVVHVYPHDPQAFTQGLTFVDGVLYEGHGPERPVHRVRKVKLENGEVLQVQKLADAVFRRRHRRLARPIFELTWQSGIGFIYDRATLEPNGTFTYPGEGWG